MWAKSDPERPRSGESRQALTERAAATLAELAQSLRESRHEPQAAGAVGTDADTCKTSRVHGDSTEQ